ncbi:MAG: VWA domain-containing protein, partial [Planctomycetes bacterium]|nr:VWA domain-containing protein [Planctomycetota bacterium]
MKWFLLALIALAAFAIPGVVLVILRLLEVDAAINDWLLRTFQITYELRLSPWITLILLLLPFLLILLYFLRLKRTPIQVPSTFLWKKSIEDLHVNSLFQWLRDNILLILQLLVLLFLIYSVLGLRLHGSTMKSRHYILLIDNSASMSVKDVAPNRLEWAKLEAIKEIDAASDNDFGMVIVFNSKATTLQAYTNDREKLRDAVRSIAATERPSRIEEALMLAASLANPVRSTEDLSMQPADVPDDQKRTMVQARGISTVVHVYSDGRFAKLSEPAAASLRLRGAGDDPKDGGLNLRYHMAGTLEKPGNANNVGIVLFNVYRQPIDAKKKIDSQQLLAWVRLANFRSQASGARVKLDVFVEGEKRHSLEQSKTIPARKYAPGKGDDEDESDEPGEAEVRFDLPAVELRSNVVMYAYLVNHQDDFPLDDHAWLAVGTTRKAKVLIVTKGNPHLDAMFKQEGTQKLAAAEWMTPDELKTEGYRKKARGGDVDLAIFDRCAPSEEADMPLANTLCIDQPPPPWQRGGAALKNPLFMASKRDHPLLKHLTTINEIRTHEAFVFDIRKNLAADAAKELELPIGHAKRRTLPTVERIVETSNQTPLLFTMSRGSHTDLVQTFPLTSDDGG